MPPQSFSVWALRPRDLLNLTFEFRNVNVIPPVGGNPARLSGGSDAYMLVHFPTQHLAEQAFYQASSTSQTPAEVGAGQPPYPPGDEPPLPPGQVKFAAAGTSRLVYKIGSLDIITYTLEGLLEAMSRLSLSVTPVANYQPLLPGCSNLGLLLRRQRYPTPPSIVEPADYHTAIEAPYRLTLSPNDKANWRHASEDVTHEERTELWHTRLEGDIPGDEVKVRAVWSPDYLPVDLQDHYDPTKPSTNFIPPFRSTLDQRDRNELVHLTSNWRLGSYTPLPVDSEQLMLTTLGSYLRLQGDWDPPPLTTSKHLTVEQWRNITTLGRDHYVRVVYAGYLFPFGHRASLVKVTERKFLYRQRRETSGNIAYLFQRMFILVREPTRSYDYRHAPFRSVTLRTRVTPNLADPTGDQIGGHGQEAFWPRVATSQGIVPFQFHLVGKDWEGREIEFTAPLIFISLNVDASDAASAVSAYNGLAINNERRRRPMSGQSVAYAPQDKPGDTTLETQAMTFKAGSQGYAGRHFRPEMEQAEVDIPAVQQLLGKKTSSTIEWEPKYLDAGFGAVNKGLVFVKNKTATALGFAVDKAGGLVAPDISISGLSRALGPVGGPINQIVDGSFKPQDIFDLNVKLLGGIDLWEIIKDMLFSSAENAGLKLPKFITVKDGDILRTSYTWKCSAAELVDTGLFKPDPNNAEFSLEAVVEAPTDGSPPTFRTSGSLTNFSVVLLPPPAELVEIGFKAVKFIAEKDKKTDVDVDMGEIKFKGILEYVQRLAELVPLDGFSDPPVLDITSQGITVGFSLGLPTVSIGVMSIQNISFAASVYLPFISGKQLNFHFAFCERQQPFTLTVYLFGGGGFFSIDIGISGVQMLEAALEFGASVALDLGVASGKASIMGGFYFQMAGSDFVFSAYFRACGSLSVLGIITVSVEFYLALTYASKGIVPHGGTLWGQCSVKVKIEILFFSTTVSIKMEREFAGSDPNFREMLTAGDWTEYCDTFSADYPLVAGG